MEVFIVDDEEISLFLTKRLLFLEGRLEDKEIRTFLSSKEALLFLSTCREEQLPDILLLDINMSEMDGWQFLEALQPHWPRLSGRCRIYILTSSLDLSDTERARGNPMIFGLIHKPVSAADIKKLHAPGDLN